MRRGTVAWVGRWVPGGRPRRPLQHPCTQQTPTTENAVQDRVAAGRGGSDGESVTAKGLGGRGLGRRGMGG